MSYIYNTHRANNPNNLNYHIPKKELYNKSFFISVIKEWNGLEHCLTYAPSLTIFKNKLMKETKLNTKIFSDCHISTENIGFSDLNSHLFNKGCAESQLCLSGNVM